MKHFDPLVFNVEQCRKEVTELQALRSAQATWEESAEILVAELLASAGVPFRRCGRCAGQ